MSISNVAALREYGKRASTRGPRSFRSSEPWTPRSAIGSHRCGEVRRWLIGFRLSRSPGPGGRAWSVMTVTLCQCVTLETRFCIQVMRWCHTHWWSLRHSPLDARHCFFFKKRGKKVM